MFLTKLVLPVVEALEMLLVLVLHSFVAKLVFDVDSVEAGRHFAFGGLLLPDAIEADVVDLAVAVVDLAEVVFVELSVVGLNQNHSTYLVFLL